MPAWMPPLLPVSILDDEGRPIPFGKRWAFESGPPDDAYSVVTHPERFAQLHGVADALLAHLLATYECEVAEDAPSDERGVREIRAVRLTSVPGTAPLRIAWSDFPGVLLSGGSALQLAAPPCGCDACDERLEDAAQELADFAIALVDGALAERTPPRWEPWPRRA